MPDEPKPAPPTEPDAGHLPMSEEMDSAKRTLPPVMPVLLALVGIAIIVASVAWYQRPTAPASGAIQNVVAVEPQPGSVMVGINVQLRNTTEKPLWINSVSAELVTADSAEPMQDEAASHVDLERYYQAYPDLRQGVIAPLKPETKIPPGGEAAGRIVVSFPVSKQQFDGRKSISVRVVPYDQQAIVITQ